jgi:hypothetical protein
MSQYIITIVPIVDENFGGSPAQTIVRVEMVDGRAVVRELILRAPDDTGIAWGEFPEVDYELLLAALTPRADRKITTARVTVTPDSAEAAEPAPVRGSGGGRGSSRRGVVKQTATKLNHLKAGRAYRRAPDEEALEQAYLRTGSIAGVAEFFDVPVHTAQGWISRLRRRNVEHSE